VLTAPVLTAPVLTAARAMARPTAPAPMPAATGAITATGDDEAGVPAREECER
jgi:hypothetical protein